jgi:uncharacterized protein YneF (UPF0154 family)
MSERVYTGPRLTLKERAQLLEWIAEVPSLGYTEIKRRIVANGLTMVTRQAVNYYARLQEKKQTAKKNSGRKPRITEEKVRAAYQVRGAYASQEEIAEEIGVSDRSFRDWQRARGLNYRQCQQRYAVPEVIDSQLPPENGGN